MDDKSCKKVIILGGGIAALAAAFDLTSRKNWRETFSEISIYQIGWRLGGKAAGGRNRRIASRIEGVGPHVWFGFYHHVFRLIRDCYAELNRTDEHPFSDWQDALKPQDTITLYSEHDGQPSIWSLQPPVSPGEPGDKAPRTSPWQLLARGTHLVREWWTQFTAEESADSSDQEPSAKEKADHWVRFADEYMERLDETIRKTAQTKPLMTTAQDILNETHRAVSEYVDALPELDEREQRLWIQQDLALTAMRGALNDWVPLTGFDALDHLDFRNWLRSHGARPRSISSPLIAGLYDFVFAFVKGDRARQDLAAGVALRLLCRATLDFRGSAVWTSPVGVGDALIAPLYEVLRLRGVQFHFFHRLVNLKLDGDRSRVVEIQLERQATIKQGYEPLIDVKGLPAWPDSPRFEFLQEGDELEKRQIDLESPWTDWEPVEQRRLFVGKDFDAIILGIGVGALPHCCSELIAADPAWRGMIEKTSTVPTSLSQIWFNRTLKGLGWTPPPPVMLSAFRPPFDTWVDFSESTQWEDWNQAMTPKSSAILRGPLRETEPPPPPGASDYPQKQHKQVYEAALAWLESKSGGIWPKLITPDKQVDWDFLVDPRELPGAGRFSAQYQGALINPSDRYVQSTSGSTRSRLSPAQPWFGNLFVCGDWTRTSLNAGCLEAAVISGLQATGALRGDPPQSEFTCDW